MSKNKTHKEVEHLRGENRLLRKQVKNLQKQLSRSNKELNKILNNYSYPEETVEDSFVRIKDNACPKCAGKLINIDLGVRKLMACKGCEYRKILKEESTNSY